MRQWFDPGLYRKARRRTYHLGGKGHRCRTPYTIWTSAFYLRLAQQFTHKWNNNFTIRVRFEVIRSLEPLSDDSVVVNFSIDSKSNALILVGEWLGPGVNSHNAQTFMSENC